jgi:adenosylcobinamide-phosphate synthase
LTGDSADPMLRTMSIFANLLALPAHATDRMIVLVLALCLDALIGDPERLYAVLPHPVMLIGRAIALFDRRLNRETRGPHTRRVRGVTTLVVLGLTAVALGIALSALAVSFRFGWIVEVLAVAVLVAQRSLYDHVRLVMLALQREGLAAGRSAVSRIVGRDPDSLDVFGVARAGIESLAENFSDGVVAPVFFYAIAGLPGLLLYKTVNTLDSMIGHKNSRYRDCGWASARFDDLLFLIPARLSGMLIVLASAFVSRGRPDRALAAMWRDARKHRSPNAGWPEAAMAGALGLALGGPRRYGELVVNDPWLGTGRARATPADLRRGLMIFIAACLIQLLIVGALALLKPR